MPRITPIQVAMGVGVSGAMVDVSSYADLERGISRSWGRRTEFDDVPPGTFSFVLDNSDGRFTPGNTASALSTTVTEGMSVCWNLAGRLVAGTVQSIEPLFPHNESAWAQVRITCDDMLGNAGRRDLGTLADSINAGATQYLMFPFDDVAGVVTPRETASAGTGLLTLTGAAGSSFGAEAGPTEETQLSLLDTLSAPAGVLWPTFPFTYPTSSLGFYSYWLTPGAASKVTCTVGFSGLARTFQFGYDGSSFFVRDGDVALAYAWTGTAHASTSTQTSSAGVLTNLAINPSLGTGTTGWAVGFAGTGGTAGLTQVTTGGPTGVAAAFARMTWTVAPSVTPVYTSYGRQATTDIAVTAGTTITISKYVRSSWSGGSAALDIVYYTSGGVFVNEVLSTATAVTANTWTRISTTVVVPPTAARITVRGYFTGTAPIIGSTLDATAVLVNAGSEVLTYFDGSTTPANVYAFSADDNPHYLSMGLATVNSGTNWAITGTLYIDGTSRGTAVYNSTVASLPYRAPTSMRLFAAV